jgi:SnoaL-like domain
MRKFTQEEAIAAVELQQMVTDYFKVLDEEGGGAALHFFTPDVDVNIGVIKYSGHEGMKNFYAAGAERLKASGLSRTGRHAFTNFRVVFPEKNRATVTVLNVTWAGPGKPPLVDATLPSIVTDVRLECRREANGQWLAFGYYGSPIFIGNDPVIKKNVAGIG